MMVQESSAIMCAGSVKIDQASPNNPLEEDVSDTKRMKCMRASKAYYLESSLTDNEYQ